MTKIRQNAKFSVILAWLMIATVAACVPANTQEAWQVDPRYSVARLSLGSGENAAEIGLARVSGDVVFDLSDPADPVVSLRISPDKDPQGTHSEMRSTSRRSKVTNREVPTGTAGGEGYYGFQATVIPDRRHATIALDLTLQRAPAPTPVADSGTTASIF